jgi:hypothetical protein
MWVEVSEIEFFGDKEDDGADGGEGSISTRFTLGCLEETVGGFGEAIGLSGARRDDPLDVLPDHLGDDLHGFDPEEHDTGSPSKKEGARDVDLFAIEDFA